MQAMTWIKADYGRGKSSNRDPCLDRIAIGLHAADPQVDYLS